MNNEEKMLEILAQLKEIRKQMDTDFSQMRNDFAQLQTDQKQMQAEQSETLARIARILEEQKQMRDDLTQAREERAKMLEEIQQVKDRATRTALTLENVTQPAIDAIGEGQELTHQMMKDLAAKREVDELRDQVQLLRTVVALHSREIEALKKAQ